MPRPGRAGGRELRDPDACAVSSDERRLLRKRREMVDRLVVERDRQKARALVREIREIEDAIRQIRTREPLREETA